MEKTIKLNKNITIRETIEKEYKTFWIQDEGKSILLSRKEKIQLPWSKWAYDENYIVRYEDKESTPHKEIIDAYSLKNKKLVNLFNPITREAIQYMILNKKKFSLAQVLTEINDKDLKILTPEKREDLRNFLTLTNQNIEKEEIKDYILKFYPQLRKYQELPEHLTVKELDKLRRIFFNTTFMFHAISQNIDDISPETTEKIGKVLHLTK